MGHQGKFRGPDGYYDAEMLCQAYGKRFMDYLRDPATQAFIKALSARTGIPITELIRSDDPEIRALLEQLEGRR